MISVTMNSVSNYYLSDYKINDLRMPNCWSVTPCFLNMLGLEQGTVSFAGSTGNVSVPPEDCPTIHKLIMEYLVESRENEPEFDSKSCFGKHCVTKPSTVTGDFFGLLCSFQPYILPFNCVLSKLCIVQMG